MSAPVWPDALAERLAGLVRATMCDEAARVEPSSWPRTVSLGRPSASWMRSHFAELSRWSDAVRARVPQATFARVAPAGIPVMVPRDATFATIDEAAALSGTMPALALVRARADEVREAGLGPAPRELSRVLSRTLGWEGPDFSTLVAASAWFATHDARGMRPREVPIAGASGKWLDRAGRRSLVSALSGKADLGLASDPWPVTYRLLDPAHADDDHAYAVALPGHVPPLPFEPVHVVVVENLSTFLNFPEVPGAVAVYGAGRACVATLPEVGWLTSCPDVAYWGDMDADGLEILDAVRARGVRCRSILMSEPDFDEWAPTCGTRAATGRVPLEGHRRMGLSHLGPGEASLYARLTGPGAAREASLRVEQERIPYDVAVGRLLGGSVDDG